MDQEYLQQQQKDRREVEFPPEKCRTTLKSRMKCSFCPSSFKNYFSLFDHLRWDHRADIQIQCKICQKLSVKTMTFHKHLLNHVPGVTKEPLGILAGGYMPKKRDRKAERERRLLKGQEKQRKIAEGGPESTEKVPKRKYEKKGHVPKSKHLRESQNEIVSKSTHLGGENQNEILTRKSKNCEEEATIMNSDGSESGRLQKKRKRTKIKCEKCDGIFETVTEFAIHYVRHARIDTRINCSKCSDYFVRPEDYIGHPCQQPKISRELAPSIQVVPPESPDQSASPIFFDCPAPSSPELSPDDDPSPEQPPLQIISIKSLQTLIEPEDSVPSPSEMTPNSPDPPSPPAFFDDLAPSAPIPDQSSSEIPVESALPAIVHLLTPPTWSHGTVLVQSTQPRFIDTPGATVVKPESDPSKRTNPSGDDSSEPELDQEIHKLLARLDLKETYECDACKEKFKFKLEWVNHVLSHDGTTHWYYRQCGKKIKTKTSLHKHLRRVHNDPEGASTSATGTRLKNNFKCDLCPKEFTARWQYNRHRISHPENRNSLCQYCGKTFPSRAERMAHIHSVHARPCDLGVICEICGKSIKGRWMKKHMESVHSDATYMCEDCGHICKTQKNLEIHKRSHLPEKPVACNFCSFRCLTSSDRLHHLAYKHLGPDGFQEIDLQPGTEKPCKCIECDKEYTTQVALDEHKLFHGDRTYKCPKCPWKSFTNYHHHAHAITFHSTGVNNMVRPIPWTCKFCGESTPNRFELYVHETSKCSLRPSHIQELEPSQQREQDPEHIQKTEKGWQCGLCKKTYKSKQDIKYHHRAVHAGTYRFVCEICGRRTNSKGNMRAHMRQHGGAYECHICGGERFKSWQDLEEHKEEKHGVTTVVKSGGKRGSRLKGQSLRECKMLGALVGLDGEEGYRTAVSGGSQP